MAHDLGPDDLHQAARVLRGGGTVVLPTDTVYGLAALPAHADVLVRLKGRPQDMPIAVLVASLDQVRPLVADPLAPEVERLVARHWPGPLTLVLPGPTPGAPTVGVRWPAHDFVVSLAAEVGPLATTSANRHGEPTPTEAEAAARSLVERPDLVLDGGPCAGVASTVLDVTGPEPVVLRAGAISPEALFGAG